jgi:hypothetical protein
MMQQFFGGISADTRQLSQRTQRMKHVIAKRL